MSRQQVESPALAGRLHNSPIPELLAYAFNHEFTGALVLDSQDGSRSGVYFERGLVSRARAADMEQALARRALHAEGLQQAELIRAAHYAQEFRLEIFSAVEQLALLTRARLEQARAAFVEGQVRALTRLPSATVYGFFPRLETLKKLPGPARALPALGLIVDCLLEEPTLERCQRQLDPFKNDRMTLIEDGAQQEGAALELGRSAAVRTVVARLRRSAHSLEELRLLNLVDERQLIACMYALKLVRRVWREGSQAGSPIGHSRVPRRASSQSLRAAQSGEQGSLASTDQRDTLPEVDFNPPPSFESEPPRRRFTSEEQRRYWQEQNAESKALEAWAMAESGDAARIAKATLMVEKALEFFPANPRIRYYAGCLYARANRLEEAAHEFRRVLSVDPDNIEAKRELDLLQRRSSIPPSKGMFGRLLKKR